MKFKNMILVTFLLLAVLTLGAVSASENVTDDDLAVIQQTDDSVAEEEILSSSESEDVLEISQKDFTVDTYEDVSSNSSGVCYISSKIQGNHYVYVDGNENYSYSSNESTDYISLSDLNISTEGTHGILINFVSNSGEKLTLADFIVSYQYIPPEVYLPSYISTGENNGVMIRGVSDIAATLYNAVGEYDSSLNRTVYKKGDIFYKGGDEDGNVFISLEKLKKGAYNFILEYKYADRITENFYHVSVFDNAAGISSSVSKNLIAYGDVVTVSITAPKTAAWAWILVDGKLYATDNLKDGSAQIVIKNLSPDRHYITVQYQKNDKVTNSKTHSVFVDNDGGMNDIESVSKLAVKKVKIKKSAKKVVIKASLKYLGNPDKGTKLTLKFKGKTYTAVTDNNGVAKFTIKKKVLKKLKVGKKVSYKVTLKSALGTLSVKKTVKVKK